MKEEFRVSSSKSRVRDNSCSNLPGTKLESGSTKAQSRQAKLGTRNSELETVFKFDARFGIPYTAKALDNGKRAQRKVCNQ
jgi:hypothetical protein